MPILVEHFTIIILKKEGKENKQSSVIHAHVLQNENKEEARCDAMVDILVASSEPTARACLLTLLLLMMMMMFRLSKDR